MPRVLRLTRLTSLSVLACLLSGCTLGTVDTSASVQTWQDFLLGLARSARAAFML